MQTTTVNENQPRKRGCLFIIKRVLKWVGISLLVLIALGVGYQTAVTAADAGKYPPPGQLIDVNGQKMHLYCTGEGSPTVVLEAGGFSFSTEWYWVQRDLEKTNRVCSYDRLGTGWSDVSPEPRAALRIVDELHTLLTNAGETAPYVLAGHSFGGLLNRIYAHQYPDEVIGMVLVDTAFMVPSTAKTKAEYDQDVTFKVMNDALQAVLWVLIHTGIGRSINYNEIQAMGYPQDVVEVYTALKSTNQAFDTYYAEAFPVRWELIEAAKAAENLGDIPLAVMWADWKFPGNDQAIYENIQHTIAAYSTNSMTRVVPGSTHGSIIGNEASAAQVIDAIRDVITAAVDGTQLQ